MIRRDSSYIGGRWVPSSGSEVIPVVNPTTEEVIGQATSGDDSDVDAAVRAASAALHDDAWTGLSLDDRCDLVVGIRDRLIERADELGSLGTSSMGAPLAASVSTVRTLGAQIDMYLEQVRSVHFEYLRRDPEGDSLIVRRPVGVVAGIVPWNVPVRSEVKKTIPALLAGCTVVLKPAPETPFGGAIFAELCSEAGVPDGVVNLVFGGTKTGEALVQHPLVRGIAFTGSSVTGKRIASLASSGIKRLQLELGGKSAALILDDANMKDALAAIATSVFGNTGQKCAALSRIVVVRSRYDEAVEGLAEAAKAFVVGDPFDPATTLGPVVSERQWHRVLGYIDAGTAEGAKIVTGGGRPDHLKRGWFVSPTVFEGVDNSMKIAREEIFGPVASVICCDDEQEAIRVANDIDYGLGGAVFSGEAAHALSVARQIDSGFVLVNQSKLPTSAPFGGIKNSGTAREQGVEGYDSFLEYAAHPVPDELAADLAKRLPYR